MAEDAVCDAVLETIAKPATRERIKEWWEVWLATEGDAEAAEREAEISRLRAEIRKVDATFENVWKALADGISVPGTKERIASLETHKSQLETQLKELEEDDSSTVTWEDFCGWLDYIAAEPDPWEIIDTFVHKIVVMGDELRFCLAFDAAGANFPFDVNENTRHEGGCSQDFMWRDGRGSNPRPPA